MSRVRSRVERRQRAEFRASCEIARDYVRRGYSIEMALTHAALDADRIRVKLRHRGIRASANTIRADLEPYVVGRLAKAAPGAEPWKRALTYDLVKMSTGHGRYGQMLLSELVLWAATPSNAPLSSSSHPRVRGWLKYAKKKLRDGNRSHLGSWVNHRCIESCLPDVEIEKVMREFWALANSIPCSHAYDWREVQASMRYQSRRVGRLAQPTAFSF